MKKPNSPSPFFAIFRHFSPLAPPIIITIQTYRSLCSRNAHLTNWFVQVRYNSLGFSSRKSTNLIVWGCSPKKKPKKKPKKPVATPKSANWHWFFFGFFWFFKISKLALVFLFFFGFFCHWFWPEFEIGNWFFLGFLVFFWFFWLKLWPTFKIGNWFLVSFGFFWFFLRFFGFFGI